MKYLTFEDNQCPSRPGVYQRQILKGNKVVWRYSLYKGGKWFLSHVVPAMAAMERGHSGYQYYGLGDGVGYKWRGLAKKPE